MYNDVGSKIKSLVKVITYITIIFVTLAGVIGLIDGSEGGLAVFLVCLILDLFIWISGLTLYGFGEMIENNNILIKNSNKIIEILENNNDLKVR